MSEASESVIILRFGDVRGAPVQELADRLANTFRIPASSGPPPQSVPQGAFDRRRGQYRSSSYLDKLQRLKKGPAAAHVPEAVLLGLTDADLFVPRLSFVFGEADQNAGVAIVSAMRLRPEFYGKEPDCALFTERLVKEAVHELGHVFGLPHCPNTHCIMHFSNSIEDTDVKGPGFCQECQVKLAARGLGRGV